MRPSPRPNSILYLAELAVALALTACHSGPALIAVIPRATAMPLWEAEHTGAQHAAAGHDIELYWNAPTREEDVDGQIQLVQRVIDQHYKGLVLAPDQPLALMTAVQRALSKNIPTVIVGSPLSIPPGAGLSYVINDDEATGIMAAARISALLHDSGTVAVVGIDPNSPSALNILHAFESALQASSPHIVISDRRAGAYSWTESGQMSGEILNAQPELNAIFSLTAAATAGAHRALVDRERVASVKLIGFQQTTRLMALVRNGQVDSLIAENTYQMGFLAIQALVAHAAGGSMGSTTRVAPTLLTALNVNSPEVQQLIDMNWSEINGSDPN